MTRQQYTKKIQHQLQVLNEQIDYKILRGQRYVEESRRHKELLRQVARQTKSSLFSRLFASFA